MQDEADIARYLPRLWHTSRKIHAQFLVFVNLRAQIFHRNKVEAGGSIRKAPNAITLAISLNNLSKAGDTDAGAIIKAWNHEASKQQQLGGGKAQALKNVLGLMPQKILGDVVLPAVSALGWEMCPWSDDAFANKRIFPGSGPRTGAQAWRERLTTTDESIHIMFLNQLDKHEKLSSRCTPPKLSKTKMDESAEQAALVHAVVGMVRSQMPIPEGIMQDQFVIPWIANDPQMHLEVNSALATRADDFAPQSMDVVKRTMDSHCGPRNIPIVDAMSKLECSKAGLDQQEFELLMSQLTFDVDAWRVHQQT